MCNFSISEVSRVFENANFTISYIGQLCESDDDPEAIEETIIFASMRWEDVSPDILRTHFTAFSFFTEVSFFLFMPSVIATSIADPLNAHLAIESIINTLPEPSSIVLKEFYRRRWRMFSKTQLIYIQKWLSWSRAPFRGYFDSHKLNVAASIIGKYACIASNLEEQAQMAIKRKA